MEMPRTESAGSATLGVMRWCAGVVLAMLLAGCGGGIGGAEGTRALPNATSTYSAAQPGQPATFFTFTGDDYGMEQATYLSATNSSLGMVLRAAVASSMTDPDFKTVSRLDIATPGAVTAGRLYSLGSSTSGAPSFPGTLYFFNGHDSTLLQTVGGTITFDSFGSKTGDPLSGSFAAIVMDGGDSATPKGTYHISARFSFAVGGFGPVAPAPLPVPEQAASL